jgi:cytidylate kinase
MTPLTSGPQQQQVPVILLDGLLASGSSVISTYVGQSYSFLVVNGNQYIRDLGTSTGFVTAPVGTFEHELQLLDFYQYIVQSGVSVHDQMYSFLTSKVSIAKVPTVVHCTGYASYAFLRNLPVKSTFWLQATLTDRVKRLLAAHKLEVKAEQEEQLSEKLQQVDAIWESKLKDHLGISIREPEAQPESVIDTSNLTTDQAFQKLATIEAFVDAYNAMATLLPDFRHDWRRWKCLNCQLVMETNQVVTQCPRCQNNNPDKFQDLD